jgi:hypothetical protein
MRITAKTDAAAAVAVYLGDQGAIDGIRVPRPPWQVSAPAHSLATVNWDIYAE